MPETTLITQHATDGRTYTITPSVQEKIQALVVAEMNAFEAKEAEGRQAAWDASAWPVIEELALGAVERVAEFEEELQDLVPGSPKQLERFAALDKILTERTYDFKNAVRFILERQFRHDGHAVLTGDKAAAATAWVTNLTFSDPVDQLTELLTVLEKPDLRFLRTVAGAAKRVAREIGQPGLATVIEQRLEVKERFAREEAETIAREAMVAWDYLINRLGSRDAETRRDMVRTARHRVELKITDDTGREGPGTLLFTRARWFELDEPEPGPAVTDEQRANLARDIGLLIDRAGGLGSDRNRRQELIDAVREAAAKLD